MRRITRMALAALSLAVAIVGIAPHFISQADAKLCYSAPRCPGKR